MNFDKDDLKILSRAGVNFNLKKYTPEEGKDALISIIEDLSWEKEQLEEKLKYYEEDRDYEDDGYGN